MNLSKIQHRILVTGGAGFIGSALSRYLVIEAGYEVLVVDKLTYAGNLGSIASLNGYPNYHFIQADICDAPKMSEVLRSFAPRTVMHLAAETHVDRSIDDAADFIQTNVFGTYTLLRTALAYWRDLSGEQAEQFRFHHISTDEVYGALGDDGYFTEATPYNPRSPYSASKASSDHFVAAWRHTYGLPTVVSNCSNNYGPFQFPEKLIPLTIIKALSEEKIPVYGQGRNIRDWLFVDDHVRALELIVTRGRVGETYNVGGGAERRNIEVVSLVCDALDQIAPRRAGKFGQLISFVDDRPGHDYRYAIDASKIRLELGWVPREAFETSLRKTVEWYVDNRHWWEPLLSERDAAARRGLAKSGV